MMHKAYVEFHDFVFRYMLHLQNKVFIYRGQEYEQIGAFTQRIQTEFPQAKMLSHNTPPDDTIRSSDGQYIQVWGMDDTQLCASPSLSNYFFLCAVAVS